MRRAFRGKDAAYDGTFFVAVKTTGIFCRPVCRAKPPKVQNVEFFRTAQEAMEHGYRPCKLCKPLGAALPSLVQRLISESPKNERELKQMGIDPSTARRQFKRYFGTTFAAYQRARKIGKAVKLVLKGDTMITAQLDAGYESASGFRDALSRMFGKPGNAAEAEMLTAKWFSTPLGPMIGIASERGIVMLDFTDVRGLDISVQRLRRRFTNVHVTPGEHRHLSKLEKELAEYFAGKRKAFTVLLDPSGTEFEVKAWEFLRAIPYGQTRSYGQQAKAIGNAAASRAVGRANGCNDIAILIPCHRVIGSNGDLTGYASGLPRKRWLLEHERRLSEENLFAAG